MALSESGNVYFWGKHSSERVTTKPKVVCRNLGTVKDIAATRGCPVSVCKIDTMVYYWGQWHGNLISEPMPIGHGSISKVFASADEPGMYRNDADVPPPMKTLKLIFDESVIRQLRINPFNLYEFR